MLLQKKQTNKQNPPAVISPTVNNLIQRKLSNLIIKSNYQIIKYRTFTGSSILYTQDARTCKCAYLSFQLLNNLKVEMIMNKYKSLVSAPKFKHPTP